MAATTTTPLIPFDTAPAAPTPNDIADDHPLLKIDHELDFLMEPKELAAALQACVSSAEPMNQAIKQCFASCMTIDGLVVKRLYHLRTA